MTTLAQSLRIIAVDQARAGVAGGRFYQAMRIAAAVRYFRNAEMEAARRLQIEHRSVAVVCEHLPDSWSGVGDLKRRISEHSAAARSWNRQLLRMTRIIRQSLFARYHAALAQLRGNV